MKYIIIIVLATIVAFFLICQKKIGETKEVTITADIEENKEEWLLKIVLKNETDNKISISELAGECVGFRLDMWAILGRGIQLYHKNNAEWIRHQAFPIMESRFIEPGMSKEVILVLDEMLPADPDDDELAKLIIDELKRHQKDDLKQYKKAYLNIQYGVFKVGDKEEYVEKYLPVAIK